VYADLYFEQTTSSSEQKIVSTNFGLSIQISGVEMIILLEGNNTKEPLRTP
jgi:hypothetical protein